MSRNSNDESGLKSRRRKTQRRKRRSGEERRHGEERRKGRENRRRKKGGRKQSRKGGWNNTNSLIYIKIRIILMTEIIRRMTRKS